jgi:MOSC domain-containing protein
MENESIARIARLWRFPVKSMRGERIDQADVTERGLIGDRAFALRDEATGKIASAKSVKTFPGLLACQASFVEPPQPGRTLPPVRINLPDGARVLSDSPDANRVLSAYFRRNVVLARSAPDDFTIDQYHPDIAGADPSGHRDTSVEQKLGAAFFAEAGLTSPVAAESFFDLFPLSVLSTSSLARLADLRPQTRFDERRFRMNVIVGADAPGFVENDWIGRRIALGEHVRIRITMPDPRCVMTTLPQEDLPADSDVLRTLVQHNRLPIANAGDCPCAGVYAVVEAAGPIRAGDAVTFV